MLLIPKIANTAAIAEILLARSMIPLHTLLPLNLLERILFIFLLEKVLVHATRSLKRSAGEEWDEYTRQRIKNSA